MGQSLSDRLRDFASGTKSSDDSETSSCGSPAMSQSASFSTTHSTDNSRTNDNSQQSATKEAELTSGMARSQIGGPILSSADVPQRQVQ